MRFCFRLICLLVVPGFSAIVTGSCVTCQIRAGPTKGEKTQEKHEEQNERAREFYWCIKKSRGRDPDTSVFTFFSSPRALNFHEMSVNEIRITQGRRGI